MAVESEFQSLIGNPINCDDSMGSREAEIPSFNP